MRGYFNSIDVAGSVYAMKICAFCGKEAECEHHLVFGRGRKQIADRDHLTINLCNRHHNMGSIDERIHDNRSAERLSKMLGEALWMLNQVTDNTRQDELKKAFIERYGENYL